MTELYLILHKVRGEPTFDIACQLPIGEEEGWIIPTSGHRAYPYWQTHLDNLFHFFGPEVDAEHILSIIPQVPDPWPDHYQVNASPKEFKASGDSLLASLGLPTKVHSAVSGKLTRRV